MGIVKAAQRPVDGRCAAGYRKKWLMKGLSRVWGNLQARFLWGWGSVMDPGYQTGRTGCLKVIYK